MSGSEKPWRDADNIRELYHGKHMTQPEIAEEFGCSRATITRWMKRLGVETRDGPQMNESCRAFRDADYLREQYHENGMNLYDLAEKHDCDAQNVLYWMRKHGIETRKHGPNGGESHPNYVDRPEYLREYFGPGWPKIRMRARINDQCRCRRCGMTEPEHLEKYGQLPHVHHIKPRREFVDGEGEFRAAEANQLQNLITLCNSCHKKFESLPVRIDRR